MTADYAYFAKVWRDATVDRPSSLWRRLGGSSDQATNEWEYLSLIDWQWHPYRDQPLPHSDTLVPISAARAAELSADRQRFVRYWGGYTVGEPAPEDRPTLVYRRRESPERLVDEVFALSDTWRLTDTVAEFLHIGPHQPLLLVSIDQETAEQIIRETRGITGATDL